MNIQPALTDIAPGLKRSGAYHIGPCPLCGGTDRFNAKQLADGKWIWVCRKCSPDKYQDTAALIMRMEGIGWAEYQRRYNDGAPPPPRQRPHPARPELRDIEPPPAEWQDAAFSAAMAAAATLQETPPALAYLAARGISADAAGRAGLGFNPAWRDVAGGRLAPGITIPCYSDCGGIWYLNVRTTQAARQSGKVAKYHAVAGSRLASLYNSGALADAGAALVCEGEFDCILLSERAPSGLAVVTMGSAGTTPDNSRWLWRFAGVGRVWLLLDNDDAGRAGLERWRRLMPRAELAPPLPGGVNDVTELWQQQGVGAVGAWLQSLGQ